MSYSSSWKLETDTNFNVQLPDCTNDLEFRVRTLEVSYSAYGVEDLKKIRSVTIWVSQRHSCFRSELWDLGYRYPWKYGDAGVLV